MRAWRLQQYQCGLTFARKRGGPIECVREEDGKIKTCPEPPGPKVPSESTTLRIRKFAMCIRGDDPGVLVTSTPKNQPTKKYHHPFSGFLLFKPPIISGPAQAPVLAAKLILACATMIDHPSK